MSMLTVAPTLSLEESAQRLKETLKHYARTEQERYCVCFYTEEAFQVGEATWQGGFVLLEVYWAASAVQAKEKAAEQYGVEIEKLTTIKMG